MTSRVAMPRCRHRCRVCMMLLRCPRAPAGAAGLGPLLPAAGGRDPASLCPDARDRGRLFGAGLGQARVYRADCLRQEGGECD
eukprot:7529606-Pyramimonas_sp.AAC.1